MYSDCYGILYMILQEIQMAFSIFISKRARSDIEENHAMDG